MITFYLDDFNIIAFDGEPSIDVNELKIFVNDKETYFDINRHSIVLSHHYEDLDTYKIIYKGETYKLIYRFITHTSKFEQLYYVNVSTLGSFYSKEKTVFRVFVPFVEKVKVVIENKSYEMNYLGKGLWEKEVAGDLECKLYHYERMIYDEAVSFSDSFALTNNSDNSESYILDYSKINHEKIKVKDYNFLNTIIYELSVRDFSSSKDYTGKYPKKFLAFKEEGLKLNNKPIGVDYLKTIGVTHIQMMPVFSYDLDNGNYNWGYNPLAYNSLHSDYINDLSNPYNRINEFREVVNYLHQNDIRVILDVVFNHVYSTEKFNLNKQIPYISFRYNNYHLANGTYCGNEVRSEGRFIRDYIVKMCKRYVNMFDIDGLRFDLMGILDIDTCNEIARACKEKKPNFVLIGEAWNMGDVLPLDQRATIDNSARMPDYYFFNPKYRDLFKQDSENPSNSESYRAHVRDILCGTTGLGYRQSINYLECHDNMTYYDYLLHRWGEFNEIKQLSRLGISLVLLSRGISFVHSGQEFFRTKNLIDNTYNASDDINRLDWSLMVNNYDSTEAFKEIIKLKKTLYPLKDEYAEIRFYDYYECLIYEISDIRVFINPCEYKHIYNDEHQKHEVLFPLNNRGNEPCNVFDIEPYSIVIAKKL